VTDSPTIDPDVNTRRPGPARRRARAVDAFIDLVLEGHLPPTASQVADRAGISLATLFRFFDTLDQLRHDSAIRMMERFSSLIGVPDIGAGSRDERIRRYTKNRVELHETTNPLALLLRSTALGDPGAAELVGFARGVFADQIRLHFEAELRALPPARREDAVATIATLTSVESWEQFRHAHGRTPVQIRRAWSRAIDVTLDEH
jgi:AcrR family transcriptional regulator